MHFQAFLEGIVICESEKIERENDMVLFQYVTIVNYQISKAVILLIKFDTRSQHVQAAAQGNSSEQCPNVNPFPLAALLQPNTGSYHGCKIRIIRILF